MYDADLQGQTNVQLLLGQWPEGFSVARGCRTMKWPVRPTTTAPCRSAAREMALRERIVILCAEFLRYGYRRVTHQREDRGGRTITV
jgi:hypothetical protein